MRKLQVRNCECNTSSVQQRKCKDADARPVVVISCEQASAIWRPFHSCRQHTKTLCNSFRRQFRLAIRCMPFRKLVFGHFLSPAAACQDQLLTESDDQYITREISKLIFTSKLSLKMIQSQGRGLQLQLRYVCFSLIGRLVCEHLFCFSMLIQHNTMPCTAQYTSARMWCTRNHQLPEQACWRFRSGFQTGLGKKCD